MVARHGADASTPEPSPEQQVEQWQQKLTEIRNMLDALSEQLARLPRLQSSETPAGHVRIHIDPLSKVVSFGDRQITLTRTELTLLEILLNTDDVVLAEVIARRLRPDKPNEQAVRVFVSYLRRKLKSINNGVDPIETVRFGYRWRGDRVE